METEGTLARVADYVDLLGSVQGRITHKAK